MGRGGGAQALTLSYDHKLAANGTNSHSSMICEGLGVTPQLSQCLAVNPRSSPLGHLSYALLPFPAKKKNNMAHSRSGVLRGTG